MNLVILVTFAGLLVLGSNAQRFPQVLTVQERLGIFGTDSTVQLPSYDYATLERLTTRVPGSKRKRLSNLVQYRLNMNGEIVTLNLKPNTDLLTPGCLIHHYHGNGSKKLYPCSRAISRCLYTGSVHGHNASWVAANICSGLQGIISMDNMTLHVSPLKQHPATNETDHVHVVFRYQGNKHVCGTTERAPQAYRIIHKPKRSATRRYIEASIVVDPSMVAYHGDALEQYVNTVLNVASDRFQDDTFKEDMVLTIKNIYKMDSDKGLGTGGTRDADIILNKFCDWQANQPGSGNSDCYILLTRTDIQYPVGNISTVGLSITSGMCSRTRKCLVVQDIGLATGLTMSHEIGHLLGMNHDGDGNTCSRGIMTMNGSNGAEAFHWSECSMADMGKFLKTRQAMCLSNVPIGVGLDSQNKHRTERPGTLYDADTQCMLYWGPAATQCTFTTDKCGTLSCTTHPKGNRCDNLSVPVMDGTDCNNTRNWCMEGRCVAMGDSDAAPVDGAWSPWGAEFSPCSRSCGGGVEIKRRRCNNPKPQYNGKPCQGTDVMAQLCNLQTCASDNDAWSHCSGAGTTRLHEQRAGWTSVEQYTGNTGCWCQVGHSASIRQDMPNCRQTPRQPFSRCMDGKCMNFGCDGRLASGLDYDKCGVCDGTGNQCLRTSVAYNKTDIAKRVITNGTRMFNDRPDNVVPRIFERDHIYMEYNRRGMVPETIEINGPIPDDTEIQVYRRYDYKEHRLNDVTPNVTYEFYVPKPTPAQVLYVWSIKLTQHCTATCGTGTTIPVVECLGYSGHVSDRLCDIRTKPEVRPLRCNQSPCPATWNPGQWSACSATCGPGQMRRRLLCVQESNGKMKAVPRSRCSGQASPAVTSVCNVGACSAVWKTGLWSGCSKTCSEGRKSRTVQCYHDNQSTTPVKETVCPKGIKPESVVSCTLGPCTLDPGCSDITATCKTSYGQDICVGIYSRWAERNCSKSCGVCSADPFVDEAICAQYTAAGTHVCRDYLDWSKLHCPCLCCADSKIKDCTGYHIK